MSDRLFITEESAGGTVVSGRSLDEPLSAQRAVDTEIALNRASMDVLSRAVGHEREDYLTTFHAAVVRDLVRLDGRRYVGVGQVHEYRDQWGNVSRIWIARCPESGVCPR